MMRITVDLEFGPDGWPDLAGGGVLAVRVQDVSLMDAPARTVASRTVPVPSGGTVPTAFALALPEPEAGARYAASAVLNLGWAPSDGEWLRPGDWLSTTHHQIRPGDRTVTVRLERYAPGG
ncbi:YbaY family lipoprotein [Kitasatospora sp. NPDC004289]